MDREEKREFVAGLAQVFAETSMVVVTRNQGLTVAEVTDLRRRMRAAGASSRSPRTAWPSWPWKAPGSTASRRC